MADTKVSALTELAATPTGDDEFVVVDKSDTSMAASGTDKRIKSSNLVSPLFGRWRPTGAKIETFPRMLATTSTAPISGTLALAALSEPLRAGVTYTSISFMSGSTALTLGTSPHLWFTLVNLADMKTLRTTVDDTAATWGASAVLTKNLSSTYTPTTDIDAYIGIMIAQTGGTLPTVVRFSGNIAALTLLAPAIGGASSTSQTTAPADATTMTTITTGTGAHLWGYVS